MFLHDQLQRTDEELEGRSTELHELLRIPHPPERTEEIRREIGYTAYESYMRYLEDGGDLPAVAFLPRR